MAFKSHAEKKLALAAHIKEVWDGNVRQFAASIGKHRNQVDRYIQSDCIWVEGAVYRKVTDI